jgi:dolichyl-diphosphooligosaccharide--protein glycosyltransferase
MAAAAASPTITDRGVVYALVGALLLNILYQVCREAYEIRMYAIREFGRIIHEFDPYFNYRATEVWLQMIE